MDQCTDLEAKPHKETYKKNTTKSRARAKVEHLFSILKLVFSSTGCGTEASRNHDRLFPGFALVNLHLHRKRLFVLA